VEALYFGATTDGERGAADAAAERLKAKLEEVSPRDPPIEMKFSLRWPALMALATGGLIAMASAEALSRAYPVETAVVRAVAIAEMAVLIAVARGPLVPNATDTRAMMQAATMRYSNDTTPSWSARRRFKASELLI
jgi:hypothetical protein